MEQGQPSIDESKAQDYIGKTVLIGVTFEDHAGNVREKKQWFGRITRVSNIDGIVVELDDSSEYCALPPDPKCLKLAPPGIYRLKSTGREIHNPDFATVWTRRDPPPASESAE